jgi:hypothetical protein
MKFLLGFKFIKTKKFWKFLTKKFTKISGAQNFTKKISGLGFSDGNIIVKIRHNHPSSVASVGARKAKVDFWMLGLMWKFIFVILIFFSRVYISSKTYVFFQKMIQDFSMNRRLTPRQAIRSGLIGTSNAVKKKLLYSIFKKTLKFYPVAPHGWSTVLVK